MHHVVGHLEIKSSSLRESWSDEEHRQTKPSRDRARTLSKEGLRCSGRSAWLSGPQLPPPALPMVCGPPPPPPSQSHEESPPPRRPPLRLSVLARRRMKLSAAGGGSLQRGARGGLPATAAATATRRAAASAAGAASSADAVAIPTGSMAPIAVSRAAFLAVRFVCCSLVCLLVVQPIVPVLPDCLEQASEIDESVAQRMGPSPRRPNVESSIRDALCSGHLLKSAVASSILRCVQHLATGEVGARRTTIQGRSEPNGKDHLSFELLGQALVFAVNASCQVLLAASALGVAAPP